MKDDEISRAGLSGHDAGLSSGEMISRSCLVGIAIEVRRLAVEDIGVTSQFDNFRFIVVIVADIDDIHNFLAARDGDKLAFHIAQSEGSFLFSVLKVQRGDEGKVVWFAVPNVLLQLLEPGAYRQSGSMEAFLIDVDVELFLESVPK